MSRRTIIILICALLSTRCATTSSPSLTDTAKTPNGGPPKVVPSKPRYITARNGEASSSPCQGSVERGQRGWRPQGTLIGNELLDDNQELSSVLSSIDLGDIQLKDGYLEAPLGTIFQGTESNGDRVEVALCDAEPQNDGTGVIWYRIEMRTTQGASWFNPCVGTDQAPNPRALAMNGIWNERGAHEAQPDRFTFACENGAIAKCVDWGYRPWEGIRNGQSMEDLHQACTRMARADYCGDGHSHTSDGSIIDMYDVLGIQLPTQGPSLKWDPSQAVFEALWQSDGAACLSQTRDMTAISDIIKQCPDRFVMNAVYLDKGDHCVATRRNLDAATTAPLRNRIQQHNPTLGMRSQFH